MEILSETYVRTTAQGQSLGESRLVQALNVRNVRGSTLFDFVTEGANTVRRVVIVCRLVDYD